MRGKALTAGFSATIYFAFQCVDIHREDIHLLTGQSHEEVGAIQTRYMGGLFLRNDASFIPVDGPCQAQFNYEFLWRATQNGEHFIRQF